MALSESKPLKSSTIVANLTVVLDQSMIQRVIQVLLESDSVNSESTDEGRNSDLNSDPNLRRKLFSTILYGYPTRFRNREVLTPLI